MSQTVDLMGLAAGHNAHDSRPRVIPTKGLPFRDSKPVPSKGWVFDAGGKLRHLTVVFRDTIPAESSITRTQSQSAIVTIDLRVDLLLGHAIFGGSSDSSLTDLATWSIPEQSRTLLLPLSLDWYNNARQPGCGVARVRMGNFHAYVRAI
jgi:hypothetical protein